MPVAKNIAVDPLNGRTLGRRYELVTCIARGGMATVFRAHDRQLDRVVAVKVPRPEFARDPRFSEQFRREALAAARLGHPNVVTVYDSGVDRDLPYIVMEHVTGRTLRDLLDAQGRLEPQTAAELLAGVAAALDHAHHAGIVHLDVKPENVLLTSDTVKVADFGLVRAARARPEYALAGTAQYIAPEVLRGGLVDGRADIYALGVVAYECLTGHAPFDGPDREEVAQRHLAERVPPPSRLVPELPAALDYAVLVATDPDPQRRYRRASDFTAALGARQRRWSDDAATQAAAAPQAQGVPLSQAATVAVPPAGHRPDELPLAWEEAPPPGRRSGFGPGGERPRSRRRLWTAIAAVIALLGGAVLGWQLFLPRWTTAPDLIGDTFQNAKAELQAKGLRVARGDPVADRRVAEGRVAVQSIAAGKATRRHAVVEVRLSSGVPFVAVPPTVGKSEEEARQALRAARLGVSVTTTADEDAPEGTVLRSTPAANTRIRENSTVALVVSEGRPQIEVPQVVGQPYDQARQQLADAGLDPQLEVQDTQDVPAGLVASTDPPAGTRLDPGSKVTVVVSRGGNVVVVPEVVGLKVNRAVQELTRVGLRPDFELRLPIGGDVVDQDPDPGTPVAPGSSVKLTLER